MSPKRRGWTWISQRDWEHSRYRHGPAVEKEDLPPTGTGNTRLLEQNGSPHNALLHKMAAPQTAEGGVKLALLVTSVTQHTMAAPYKYILKPTGSRV